jgi:hypothetical protein
VATAAHVVSAAHFWEEPVRLEHLASGKTELLRSGDRALLLNDQKDVAAIVFDQRLPFPEQSLPLGAKDMYIRVGVEIGWIGFPAIATELCFFSGRVSAYLETHERYLVDGVAINGVSGGPAFTPSGKEVSLIGVVSAYMPNRQLGETLPGLAVVTDVAEFHAMIEGIKSVDEARSEQAPRTEAPAPSGEPAGPRPPSGEKGAV